MTTEIIKARVTVIQPEFKVSAWQNTNNIKNLINWVNIIVSMIDKGLISLYASSYIYQHEANEIKGNM